VQKIVIEIVTQIGTLCSTMQKIMIEKISIFLVEDTCWQWRHISNVLRSRRKWR